MTPPNEAQQRAVDELLTKSLKDIQIETARTWANRAWAAETLAARARLAGDYVTGAVFRHDATEYAHEAIEHAALTGEDAVLVEVREVVASGLQQHVA